MIKFYRAIQDSTFTDTPNYNQIVNLSKANPYDVGMGKYTAVSLFTQYFMHPATTDNLESDGSNYKIAYYTEEHPKKVLVKNYLKSNIKIVPNPTSTSFSIVGIETDKIKSINIFDFSGKFLKSFSESFLKNQVFSVSDLTAGIYFVEILSNSKNIERKKLVIVSK